MNLRRAARRLAAMLTPIVLGLGVAAAATQETLDATVERAVSGDTLIVRTANGPLELRLADIGAPQGAGFFAPSSTTLLNAIASGQSARITLTGRDGTDRAFGLVRVGELNVNLELVRRGAAWVCWDYALSTDYMPFENRARRQRLGLWSGGTTELQARGFCRARPPANDPVGGAPR